MINLIPKEEKIQITEEYRRRLLVVFFLLLLCTGAIAILLSLPTYILFESKYKTVLDSLDVAKHLSLERRDAETELAVRDLNDRVSVILSPVQKRSVVEIVSVVVSKKVDGVYIQRISYDAAQNSGNVSISGVALSRDKALSFVKALESAQIFSKIDLPVGSLVKEKNLDFIISATLK
ncbi:MAG: PilN domain-containing protein [Candidatus Paceibacterota bacterium]|jgi:hypothetical protein